MKAQVSTTDFDFQPGEGLSSGLLCDCEIFANLRLTFVSSSNALPCVVQQRESLERKSQERQSRTVERRQPAPAPVQEVSQVQRQEQRQHRVEERQEVRMLR